MAGSAPFDQLKGRIHFVGAIDRQINAVHRIEAEQRNVQFRGQHLTLKRGGHADDVFEFATGELGSQALDHQRRSRTGTQTQHHAVLDLPNGCISDSLLHLVLKIRHQARSGGRDGSKGVSSGLAVELASQRG
ncbi:MAG: Uncharacterised protein [Synechococcus sp. CC9902]|nr:MAG: Uncharacterised protein [Synechococcus sp. CC9902]